MRFRSLHARVFGPLRDLRLDLAPDLALIYGRNESGKSSLRSALETLLYGFQPASREAHPLYRFDESAGDLCVEAELSLDSGEVFRVERVLQSAGKLRTAGAGEPFEGTRQGNAALAHVSFLPRQLFRSIYSLELEQLAALERGVQLHVDDLLLPETEALDLRPSSEVRLELREEHQALWRPGNRGRPAAKRLREELAAARARAREAALRERELREARTESEELEVQLAGLRERRRELDQAREQAFFLEQLFLLSRRRRALPPAPDLSPLGDLPLVDPALLDGEIEELEQAQAGPRARLARAPEELGPAEARVLAAAADLEFALEAGAAWAAECSRSEERAEGARLLRAGALRDLRALLGRPPAEAEVELARALPLEELAAAQSKWEHACEDRAAAPAGPGRAPRLALVLGAAGVALAALAALSPLAPRLAAGGAGLAFLAALLTLLLRGRTPAAAPAPPPPPDSCRELLRPLAAPEALLANPAALLRLVEGLERARTSLEDADAAEAAALALRAELEKSERRWRELCGRLDLATDAEAPLLLARLREALARTREAEKRIATDRAERELAQQSLDASAPALERKRAHRQRLEQALRTAEPAVAEPGEAFARVVARAAEARFVVEREAELARDPRFAALRDDPRVAGDAPPESADWLPEVAEARERELQELDVALEAGSRRLGQLVRLLETGEASGPARAREEVLALEEQLEGVERERDRLALLEAVLARAEQDFRDRHQPDVLRRASHYLAQATEGRHLRLDYRAGPEGGLLVSPRDRDEPLPVGPPLSRGTLDQIFLCLRLGLLDHLDADRESLPLVLDDALVRMDDGRRAAVYALLGEISQRRQILLLTCHAALADELEKALGRRRVVLPG